LPPSPPALLSLLGNFGKTSLRAFAMPPVARLRCFGARFRLVQSVVRDHRPELPWYQFRHRYFFWRRGASRDARSRPNA
jgi:hypothetical protein